MNSLQTFGVSLARRLPPEAAHRAAIAGLKTGLGPKAPSNSYPRLATKLCGLSLPNPVGLAAGFDKDAEVPDAMLAAGFGFVECGTVTPLPQAGNPKPRLFRLREDKAIINRMGFNNSGLDVYCKRLSARKGRPGIVGANVGANKASEDRVGDYNKALTAVWDLADYFTINISSPNTPGLRDLQGEQAMEDLLGSLQQTRQVLSKDKSAPPMFLKVAPDLDGDAAGRITEQALTYGVSAIIISNTTLDRPASLKSQHAAETGGLSGTPLTKRADKTLSEFSAASGGRIPLIGVGGISSGADAYRKIRLGASAVQLYSALVYEGPELVSRICADLDARLVADGFDDIAQAVGTL